jgi:hypothetical protein
MVRLVSSKHGEDLVWDMALELDDLRISNEHEEVGTTEHLEDHLHSRQTAVLCSALQSVLQHQWPDPSVRQQLQGLHLSALNNICDTAYVSDWLKPQSSPVRDTSTAGAAGTSISSGNGQQQHPYNAAAYLASPSGATTSSNSSSSSSTSSISSTTASEDHAEEQLPPIADPSDLYGVLQVPPTAKPADIKASFRKLALRFHPDVNSDADASERFKVMVEAYGKAHTACTVSVLGIAHPH